MDRAQSEAQVESVLELSDVAVCVLRELEGVVGAGQPGLDIAQDRVNSAELRQPHRWMIWSTRRDARKLPVATVSTWPL